MRTLAVFLVSCACFLGNASAQPYTISTIAGTERLMDGSPATTAPLRLPVAVALDAQGNLYIVDQADNRIRKVNTAGIISTYAGTGIAGFSGDRGPATSATLNFPAGIAIDAHGNMYVADEFNNVVRRIAADGTINTVAGNGNPTYAGDNGPATSAQLSPTAVALDQAGNLYIADGFNYRIRKVDTNGIITTIAGTGVEGYSGDNGPATSAKIDSVTDLTVDNAGNVYIADYYNYEVREINTSGMISDFAGGVQSSIIMDGVPATSQVMVPNGVAFDGAGNIYIADANINNPVIRRVDLSSGLIYTVAGNGTFGFTGDGASALAAELGEPAGLVIGNGVVYFADEYSLRVREVANYIISTFAGAGIRDNGLATNAFLNFPEGIAIDGSGDLLVADTFNAEARRFKVGGNINSLGELQDGTPMGATVDTAGNFYVTAEEPSFPMSWRRFSKSHPMAPRLWSLATDRTGFQETAAPPRWRF
jgi:trimeric autotransporter adhesin